VKTLKPILFWIAVVLIVFGFVSPILWIFITAFKPRADILSVSLGKMLVFKPSVESFEHVFTYTTIMRELANSAIISVCATILVMVFALPAAYSFARWNTGGGHLLFVTLSTRMFPGFLAAMAYFFVYKDIALMDTHLGLILFFYYFNISFATFLLYGFFREIAPELEQAAMVDGYSRIDVLRKIVVPLILPGVAITAVFVLVFNWNEFLFSVLFTKINARTVAVGLAMFWGSIEIQWGPMCAAASMAVLPTLAAAWFMQRYIVRGLTFGAVKG
jgi:multiple sugar transport system permease protein